MRVPARARPVVLAVILVLVFSEPAGAVLPYPSPGGGNPYAYGSYMFIENGDCADGDAGGTDLPSSFDCDGDWKYTDYRDANPPSDPDYDEEVINNPQELFGVRGTGLNRAWEVSTGRPDVVIAVLDSGIQWEDHRPNLLRKHYLNKGELPVPFGGPNPADTRFDGYDVTGDGFFNVADYVGDPDAEDLNGNGDIDPDDLIRIFSNSIDDDGNGYVDDISGWDFFENDNNPQDDSDYGHGTGEAEDSGGEAGLEDGQCPNCMLMSMRVGDSFVADVNHWAEAVVYAVDNGASVVQEALGTLNHTSFGQAAADYAYENGVIINASEADEAAGHHNWPAAYDHTMVVNSILRFDVEGFRAAEPNSYLYFNGCTNFGGYTYVSIPSTSCSSEATGRSSGVSGLLQSAARNAVEAGDMTRYIRDDGTLAPFPLSSEEMMQLWRLSADDIDFSSDCAPPVVHSFCDDKPGDVPANNATPNNYDTSIPASARYQSVKGWDYFFGYGRNNAARLLRFIGRDGFREYVPPGPYGVGDVPGLEAQDRIPPEADISWPPRWRQYAFDADGNLLLPDDPADPDAVVVEGRVAANRVTEANGTFDWVLEWAPHVQGLKDPVGTATALGSEEQSHGPWTSAASGTGLTSALEGELGRIPVEDLAAALEAQPNPFDPATDPTSEFQPERFAIRLRVRVIAHPSDAGDTVNNEAVMQKQVDVYATDEPLAGAAPSAETVLRYDIGLDGEAAGGAGAPSFHDLDGDGRDEMLLPTEDGLVHAYTNPATGEELPGWPVMTRRYPGWRESGENAYTRGSLGAEDARSSLLLGTVAAADLDDDGELEVMAADLEGRLYAWEPDGSERAGFPVGVDLSLSKEPPCNQVRPACDDYSPGPSSPGGIRDELNDRDWGINSAPSVGELDPETPGLEIVVGANDGHVYAWHQDGSPVEGWPVFLRDPAKVAAMDPATRHVTYVADSGALRGVKIIVTPSIGDIDADGDNEVVLGVNEEYVEDPNADLAGNPLLPALTVIADPGNTRFYALHHDGTAHPETAETMATPHVHDQAYVEGWPVPIAMAITDLLPYVGEGTNSPAVLANVTPSGDGDEELEVVVTSMAGPGYILNHDGSSFFGKTPDGKYRTLASYGYGPGSQSTDEPTLVAVGAMAIGSLDGGRHLTVAGPGAGLNRALDVILPAQQLNADDHLLAWNASTGQFEPTFPITLNDLQFFTQPIVGDLDGDGLAEVIQSTAVSDLVAAGITDHNLTATRYFTGGWGVTAAGLGPSPVSGQNLQLAMVTREGWLRLFPTTMAAGSEAACRALSEWPEYGHDARNSGNYHTDGERPYPVTELSAQVNPNRTVTLTFIATGDDRDCGAAIGYRIRVVPGAPADPAWDDGTGETQRDTNEQAGEQDGVTIGPLAPGGYTVMVRADDDAGNGSAIASIQVTVSGAQQPPGGGDGDGPISIPPQPQPVTGLGPPVPPLCPGLEDLPGNHLVGTSAADRIVGTPGRDVICGLGGPDELRGLGGNDLIIGAGGGDEILGGRGGDVLRGGAQNDLLGGGPGIDRCRPGTGNDTVQACEP